MAETKPYRVHGDKDAQETVAIIDYDSKFTKGIEAKCVDYNRRNPSSTYKIATYKASELNSLDDVAAGKVIHTGGQGDPVEGTTSGDRLYICHSHQWKAKQNGGEVEELKGYNRGTGSMNVEVDDPVIGQTGESAIEKYHSHAVTEAPKNAQVIATSEQTLKDGRKVKTAEALRYDDGSISVQGHPGGKTPSYIIDNFLKSPGYMKKAA